MNIIEPFASLKIDNTKDGDDDDDGRFVSFWRFSCLPGCLVCELPKPFELTTPLNEQSAIDACFGSEYFLVSRE